MPYYVIVIVKMCCDSLFLAERDEEHAEDISVCIKIIVIQSIFCTFQLC